MLKGSLNLFPPPLSSFLSPLFLSLSASRRETLRVPPLWPTLTGLLSHDQAPADSRWVVALPVHGVPGVLQQPGRHAETHQEPHSAGFPPRLEHQQHLPVHLTRLSQPSPLHRHICLQTKVLTWCSFNVYYHCIWVNKSKACIFLKDKSCMMFMSESPTFIHERHNLGLTYMLQ